MNQLKTFSSMFRLNNNAVFFAKIFYFYNLEIIRHRLPLKTAEKKC
jgi:hypothetical protein